jgi:hypothetical protein
VATLIAVYTSGGCLGRCDARCYNANEPRCTCICGGVNHGAGEAKATENTAESASKWLQRAREAGRDITRTLVGQQVSQPALF